MVKLQKACRNYSTWKATHSPELKPWLFPEQNSLPRLNPADIGKLELTESPVLDERNAVEVVAVSDGADEDDSSAILMESAEQLSAAQQATNYGTVEEITTAELPSAAPEPLTHDTAVAAGAD